MGLDHNCGNQRTTKIALRECYLGSTLLQGVEHIPLLWEEFFRAGIEWNLADTNVIDVATIFRAYESRSLSSALKFYCGKTHVKAHGAAGDVRACLDIFTAQCQKYCALEGKDVPAIARECQGSRQDLAGHVVQDMHGESCYGFGFDHSSRTGRRVKDDPWLAEWMLSRAFPEHTKRVLRKLLTSRNINRHQGLSK